MQRFFNGILLVSLLLLAGCVVQTLPPPEPVSRPVSISDIAVQQLTPTSVEISWRTSEPTFGFVRLNNADRNQALDTDNARPLKQEDYVYANRFRMEHLQPNRTYYAKIEVVDQAGKRNVSPDFSIIAKSWGQTPLTGAIRINRGAEFTDNQKVNLELTVDAGQSWEVTMMFSNDEKVWSPAEPFSNNRTYLLSAGDGRKTIYVRFQDRYGNDSQTYSDRIVLDTHPPIIENVSIHELPNDMVEIRWHTGEPSFGLVLYNAQAHNFSLRSDDNRSYLQNNYGTEHSLRLNRLEPEKTYYAKIEAVDRAGNHGYSEEFSFSLRLTDHTPPTGSVKINNGARFTNNDIVTLQLAVGDDQNRGAKVAFSYDGSQWSLDELFYPTKNISLPGGDGRKTVYIRFRDQAGNYSQIYSDSIELDTHSPAIDNVVVHQLQGDMVEIRWRTDEPSFGFIQYNTEIRNDSLRTNDNRNQLPDNFGQEHRIRIDHLRLGKEYYGKIEAVDRAGNRKLSPEFSFHTAAGPIGPQPPSPPEKSANVALVANGARAAANNDDRSADRAIDGKRNTYWEFAPKHPKFVGQPKDSFRLYWEVHLKQVYHLKKIRILIDAKTPFTIQYRQKDEWVDVLSVAKNQLNMREMSDLEFPTNIKTGDIRLIWEDKPLFPVRIYEVHLFD